MSHINLYGVTMAQADNQYIITHDIISFRPLF